MYRKVASSCQNDPEEQIHRLQDELFTFLQLKHQIINIRVNQEQTIHAIILQGKGEKIEKEQVYFVGHGFGGSSLMQFGMLEPLLARGMVVLWEIRGMGMSHKLEDYPDRSPQQTQDFFLQTITVLLTHFNPKNSVFICLSFSAYLCLRYIIKFPKMVAHHLHQVVLFSPVGVTTKEQDYKNHCNGCGDCLYSTIVKIGWNLKISYKSIMRRLCCCFKKPLLNNYLEKVEQSQKQKEMLNQILSLLIQLPNGSESLFFNYFEARVLPKIALQPLMVQEPPIKVTIVHGGQADWVDKKGAIKLSERFPQKINLVYVQDCGHNIPFRPSRCISLFNQLFQ